jgi:biotin transporter BioY
MLAESERLMRDFQVSHVRFRRALAEQQEAKRQKEQASKLTMALLYVFITVVYFGIGITVVGFFLGIEKVFLWMVGCFVLGVVTCYAQAWSWGRDKKSWESAP